MSIPAHPDEERVERVGVGGVVPGVRPPHRLRVGPAAERDVREQAHEIHPRLATRRERPVDDVDLVAGEQHVVGAQVEVHEMLAECA